MLILPRWMLDKIDVSLDARRIKDDVNILITTPLQCIMPALAFAPGESRFTLYGGTHFPEGSISVNYLQNVFIPMVSPIARGIASSR